jgi:molybdenum cofactor cytidylyltransferase
MNRDLTGVLLAAGASTRLGQPKQLIEINGVPMVAQAAQLMLEHCPAGVIVVTGAHASETEACLRNLQVEVIKNENWASGMASSIACGVMAFAGNTDAVLLMLCDQPRIQSTDLQQLVSTWRRQPEQICASAYNDTLGVPAIFPASCRYELSNLKADVGAQRLIRSAESISIVEMPNAGFDVDTPEHLDKLL